MPGTVRLGGREVNRIGFGAIHLCGPRAWGPPADPAAAATLLRKAVDSGVSSGIVIWASIGSECPGARQARRRDGAAPRW